MLYLTCTMIYSVDLAHYGVSCDTDWVSVDCGTINYGYNRICIDNCDILESLKVTKDVGELRGLCSQK